MIYATDDARIREFAMRMPAMRVVVNTPAPQGSIGITTNSGPAMTLGCGAMAGNSTSDNVGPLHLINIKRLAYARAPARRGASGAARRRLGAGRVQPATAVAAAVDRYLAPRGTGARTGHTRGNCRRGGGPVLGTPRRCRERTGAPAPACKPGGG